MGRENEPHHATTPATFESALITARGESNGRAHCPHSQAVRTQSVPTEYHDYTGAQKVSEYQTLRCGTPVAQQRFSVSAMVLLDWHLPNLSICTLMVLGFFFCFGKPARERKREVGQSPNESCQLVLGGDCSAVSKIEGN